MAEVLAVVVAAGQGNRMGPGPKKQFRLLAGQPLINYALKTLESSPLIEGVSVVVGAGETEWFRQHIVEQFSFKKITAVVEGGFTRQESVWEGLKALPPSNFVLVHDGVRPFFTREHIEMLRGALKDKNAATLAVMPKDTIKLTATEQDTVAVSTLPRDRLWQIQTPQMFCRKKLEMAHEQAQKRGFFGTDDASLLEYIDESVGLVQGSYRNIKITTPEDILFAEGILGGRPVRVGFGYDVHRLAADRPLVLGGVNIPFRYGLVGHSDADVLTHAVMDALLGAAGERDIGTMFPDNNSIYAGVSSMLLLEKVASLLCDKGLQVNNLDTVIVAEEPRLSSFIPQMCVNMARVLKVAETQLNIKATTTEGLGFTGTGSGIAAYATASLYSCLV